MGGWSYQWGQPTGIRCYNTPYSWQMGWMGVAWVRAAWGMDGTEYPPRGGMNSRGGALLAAAQRHAARLQPACSPASNQAALVFNRLRITGRIPLLQVTGTELRAGQTIEIRLLPRSNPASVGVRIAPTWVSGKDPFFLGLRDRAGTLLSVRDSKGSVWSVSGTGAWVMVGW